MRNIVLQISNLIRIKTKTPVSGVSPDEPLEQAWHKANTWPCLVPFREREWLLEIWVGAHDLWIIKLPKAC